MSCRDCKDHSIAAYYRWKNANIEFTGCKRHVTEVIRTLTAVQQMVELQFDAEEIDTLLTKMDWTGVLPEQYQIPFLKIVSQLGALAGIHLQLLHASRDDDGGSGGEAV